MTEKSESTKIWEEKYRIEKERREKMQQVMEEYDMIQEEREKSNR